MERITEISKIFIAAGEFLEGLLVIDGYLSIFLSFSLVIEPRQAGDGSHPDSKSAKPEWLGWTRGALSGNS